MREALGLVETIGLSSAILVADSMSKTANVNIIGLENTKGLGYMTIKVTGDVGAVNAAVACGKQIAIENSSYVTSKVIPRPTSNIEISFCQLNKKEDILQSSDTNNRVDGKEENTISIDDVKNVEEVEKVLIELEEDKKEGELVKVESESDKTKEVLDKQSSTKQKASSTENSKPRRSNKKIEPKKN